jgi:twitching motility protein PilT
MEQTIDTALTELPSDVAEILGILVTAAAEHYATDLHLQEKGPLMFRSRGKLNRALNWESLTDGNGMLTAYKGTDYNKVSKALLAGSFGGSVVWRLKTQQIRVQPINCSAGEKLFIRLQPLTPPALSSMLKETPDVLNLLENPDGGLILISGPIGGGKTTLAAAIVSHWASKERHVFSIEDPIEYSLSTNMGSITQVAANLTMNPEKTAVPLSTVSTQMLRADIDGLLIGECRDERGIKLSLAAASADEPVLTTIQAGGIADAIIRTLNLATPTLGAEVARLTLASCLHAVIYVNLSFDKKGLPVPVLMCLPTTDPKVRRIIAETRPELLAKALETHMTDASIKDKNGMVTSNRAIGVATRMSADRELTLRALRRTSALSLEAPRLE